MPYEYTVCPACRQNVTVKRDPIGQAWLADHRRTTPKGHASDKTPWCARSGTVAEISPGVACPIMRAADVVPVRDAGR